MHPKVFVCHATEDKDRFVRNFGIKLRKSGIDAWVDEWEILPGDRLTRKIFDDGIKNANMFIIVLSRNSIEKPWVKEELDAAVVKRIEQGTKIVPVVLDDCEVPVVLRATHWVKIDNLNDYEAQMRRLIGAIFESSDKPPLGAPPTYVNAVLDRLPGLTKVDTLVLKVIGEYAIEKGCVMAQGTLMNPSDIVSHIEAQDISFQDFIESLIALEAKY